MYGCCCGYPRITCPLCMGELSGVPTCDGVIDPDATETVVVAGMCRLLYCLKERVICFGVYVDRGGAVGGVGGYGSLL